MFDDDGDDEAPMEAAPPDAVIRGYGRTAETPPGEIRSTGAGTSMIRPEDVAIDAGTDEVA